MKKSKKKCNIIITILAVFLIVDLIAFSVLYNFGFSGLRKNPVPSEEQIKVACVGDSITYGHGIKNWSKNNYPVQLGNILGSSYCVGNFGVNGSTAQDSGDKPYREQKIYSESIDFDADVIVIMLGSNDSKAENWTGVKTFKEQYSSLVKSYIENNKTAKIILCSPAQPFYVDGASEGAVKFDINPEVFSEICNAVEEIANENNCTYIDINSLTGKNSQWFLKDGVHPDVDGAYEIAKYISNYIIV